MASLSTEEVRILAEQRCLHQTIVLREARALMGQLQRILTATEYHEELPNEDFNVSVGRLNDSLAHLRGIEDIARLFKWEAQ